MNDKEKPRQNESNLTGRVRSTAACDACRARKVRCIYMPDKPKCSICTELGIECTQIRPRKKRGPKNRYLETLRSRLDVESPGIDPSLGDSPDLSSPSVPATSPQSISCDIEHIAPLPVLQQIVKDWFGWIHPVAPIFHRSQMLDRIMQALIAKNGSDSSFLVLVASLCAAVVASLRRRRGLYGAVTVDRCFDIAERHGLWDRNKCISLEWVLAMYNFTSATHHEQGIGSSLAYRLSAESAMGVKYLLYHDFDQMSLLDQQILKRLYWLIYAGQCTFDMHGWPLLVMRQAHEQVNALIPLDVPIDSLLEGIPEASHAFPSQSYIPGLNALARLFLIWQASQSVPIKTMEHLQESMKQAQQALTDLPPQLKWRSRPGSPMNSEERVVGSDFGTDVQTVNLKVTQLHIRANLLEQMNGIARAHNLLLTPTFISEERHRVVDELLDILYHMPNEVFDANGYSVVPKIRDIGGALLDEVRTGVFGANQQATLNLDRLLAKLQELDVRCQDQQLVQYF
ncbi:hypothetical protein P171DRAFT_475037 [Karstenula rhodostoma CBS 690.94]|uniref:Zn(2)-C6 fungal-type domain-containing protein n=1 Tax=Karstenula rhodostoma CBS 690.94 TaxID=1392251 RepID=A0A9P4U8T6_9PLEO|nr:hypothetical protein P171DRAFT_475037 [Karstenula rhodostoma CBS 690.94]